MAARAPGNKSKITAKTSLEIKKPKIGLPLIDENGTVVSEGSIFMEVEVKAEKFDETQSNTYQGQSFRPKRYARPSRSLPSGMVRSSSSAGSRRCRSIPLKPSTTCSATFPTSVRSSFAPRRSSIPRPSCSSSSSPPS